MKLSRLCKMEESSSKTSRKRPKNKFVGGFGNYCCVPSGKSAFYDKNRDNKRKHVTQIKEYMCVIPFHG